VDAHGRSSAIDRYILLYQLIGERHSLKCICLDVDRVAAKREGQMIIKGCDRYQNWWSIIKGCGRYQSNWGIIKGCGRYQNWWSIIKGCGRYQSNMGIIKGVDFDRYQIERICSIERNLPTCRAERLDSRLEIPLSSADQRPSILWRLTGRPPTFVSWSRVQVRPCLLLSWLLLSL